MRKRGAIIEWQVAEDDRAWQALSQPIAPTAASQRRVSVWTFEMLCLLLVIGGVAIWYWYTLYTVDQLDNTNHQTAHPPQAAAGVPLAAPDAASWGPVRSLETPYFIFRFRQHDAQTVIAVAPQLDELYTTLWHNFGLPIIPLPERLVIEVNVTQQPGFALNPSFQEHRLVVPSPAVYRAPVASKDADLLLQSLALPLLARVSAQASERYQMGATGQPMLSSLELWQIDHGCGLCRSDLWACALADVAGEPRPSRYLGDTHPGGLRCIGG